MARRVPKPLVPLLVAVSAIGLAMTAALPSFAGPNITPPIEGPQHPLPAEPSGAPTTTTAPAPQPSATNTTPALPKTGPTEGPKDCAGCANPGVD